MTTLCIDNDIICGLETTNSPPHVSSGRNLADFVIIHFTGSHGTYSSSNEWARDPSSKVSWHITIGRTGVITQLLDFRKIAWHAGKSSWFAEQNQRQYTNLNKYSIGIELANSGKLTRVGDEFHNSFGERIKSVFIDDEDVAWEAYTEEQLNVCFDVALSIAEKYNCVDILGHSDIAPDRKIDPGSAFPLEDLRTKLRNSDFYNFGD